MSGALIQAAAAVQLPPVELTLTIGEETVYGYPYPYTGYTGFGYDNGNDYFGYAGGFGALSSATYSDAGSTTRTIEVLAQYAGAGAYAGQSFAEFVLTGSVPNSDAVFRSLYNVDTGETLSRADATYSNMGSYTVWSWSGLTVGWSSLSGSDAIEIRFA